MNDNWTPTKGNVYARRKKAEEKTTASGIILAANEKANHDRVLIDAVVLAIGAEVTEVQVGDRIIFPRYEAWPMTAKNSREDDEFFVAEKNVYGKISPHCDIDLGQAESVTIHA